MDVDRQKTHDQTNIPGSLNPEDSSFEGEHFFGSSWLKPALGPHSEDLNAKRLAFHAGPCWLKLLVADRVAGSIIGKGGKVITEIENSCGCIMKLSPGQTFFPGTQERIVVIAGTIEGISQAVRIILSKVRMFVVSEYRSRQSIQGYMEAPIGDESDIDISLRAVVPNSAVSCIIGRGGEVVKDINRATGAMIRIGDRMTVVHERIVQVTGNLEQVHSAMYEVATRIQSDKNLKEHLNVVYTKSAMQSNRGLTASMPSPPPSPPQTSAPQVQTPSGPLPVNAFVDVVTPNMYSQPCTISLSLPPGTISTSVLRKVEAQTGANLRFRQTTGSVQISGSFGAVHTAHILLLKETTGTSPPYTPPHISSQTATPSPTAAGPQLRLPMPHRIPPPSL
jgi:transcription antitermination factor NusA-like protein